MFNEVVDKYFCQSIMEYQGYNLINTAVYAVVLLFIAFFVVYPFFNRRGVSFNFNFFKSVFPYILFGSTVRIFEDLHLVERSCNPLSLGFYLVSPGIYIMIGLFTICSLIASIKIGKKYKMDSMKLFGLIGLIPAIPVLLIHLLNLKHPEEFLLLYLIFGAITVSFFYSFKLLKKKLFEDKMNLAALMAQTLDGSSTFIALAFTQRFSEQHVASNFLISSVNSLTRSNFFGPLAFLLAKIILVLLIVHFLDQEVKNKNLNNFIKLFISIIGFAPGLRDSFALGIL